MKRAIFVSAFVGLVVAACDDPSRLTGGGWGEGGEEEGEGAGPGADPNQPGNCKEGAPHPGFAGHDFVADRKPGGLGDDRRRVKPFSSLRTELARALGQAPAGLDTNAAAFGEVPPRWFAEPQAGAVSLYTTYGVAFTGCYDTMTQPAFSQAPTAQSASDECSKMQRKFWQRTPSPDEVKVCAELATAGLASEPAPRRRWAHACAAVLTSASFTTY